SRMERLQVKPLARALASPLSDGEPGSLPHLVTNRLSRPAQVAIDLAAQEFLRLVAMLDGEWQHQFGGPGLARVIGLLREDLQSGRHADVHDAAQGAEGRGP